MKKIIYLILLVSIAGCDTNNSTPNSIGNSVEDQELRTLVLTDLVDSLITPSYENLSEKLNELNTSFITFKQIRDITSFNVLKHKWKEAYIAWQYVEMYNINTAEEIFYCNKMNTYPANSTIINNNIQTQNFNFSENNFSSFTSQGFPTIDYLLYGLDIDTSLVLAYYQDPNNQAYLTYLERVIDELMINTQNIQTSWINNRDEFISSNRNTVNSSFNLFVNDFIFYYEKGFRANKFGIPAGVYSSTFLLGNLEAYYCQGISKELSLHALEAITDVFVGKSFIGDQNINSISSYINSVDGPIITSQIVTKLDNAKEAIGLLDNNFVAQIQNDNFMMLQTFDVIQEAVPLLKIDMLAAINIRVDYIDADGD
tara:strand:+ start:391 stop:1500 length:1110 start_codon:yes stop_codon:yes gene_type:complete